LLYVHEVLDSMAAHVFSCFRDEARIDIKTDTTRTIAHRGSNEASRITTSQIVYDVGHLDSGDL
jgi:hypothetical protein